MKGVVLFGFIISVLGVLIFLFYFGIKKFGHKCHPKIKQLAEKVKAMLMFNSALRYFQLSFLSTVLMCDM